MNHWFSHLTQFNCIRIQLSKTHADVDFDPRTSDDDEEKLCTFEKKKETLADFIRIILSRLDGQLRLFLAPLLCLGSARSPGPEGDLNSGFRRWQIQHGCLGKAKLT